MQNNKEITNKNKKISFWQEIKEDIKITFQKKKLSMLIVYLPIATILTFVFAKGLINGSVEIDRLPVFLLCLTISFFVIFSFFAIHRYLGRQQKEVGEMLSNLSKKAKNNNPTKYRQIRNISSLLAIFFFLNYLDAMVYFGSLKDNGHFHEILLALGYLSTAIFGFFGVGLFFAVGCSRLAQKTLKEKSNAPQ